MLSLRRLFGWRPIVRLAPRFLRGMNDENSLLVLLRVPMGDPAFSEAAKDHDVHVRFTRRYDDLPPDNLEKKRSKDIASSS